MAVPSGRRTRPDPLRTNEWPHIEAGLYWPFIHERKAYNARSTRRTTYPGRSGNSAFQLHHERRRLRVRTQPERTNLQAQRL
jgi:hypothetical protein